MLRCGTVWCSTVFFFRLLQASLAEREGLLAKLQAELEAKLDEGSSGMEVER
jgi:hypothetical protein